MHMLAHALMCAGLIVCLGAVLSYFDQANCQAQLRQKSFALITKKILHERSDEGLHFGCSDPLKIWRRGENFKVRTRRYSLSIRLKKF